MTSLAEQLKSKIGIREVPRMFGFSVNGDASIKCILPGHQDNDPSFHFYDDTNTCFCFGCHRGGDVIDLYSLLRCGNNSPEDNRISIRELAERSGIPFSKDEEKNREYQEKKEFHNQVKSALKHYFQCCHQFLMRNEEVKQWILEKWGFNNEMLERYCIGYSPIDNPRTIHNLILKQGIDRKAIWATGLFTEDCSGNTHLHFQNRITIPYFERDTIVYGIGRETPWTPRNKWETDRKYKKMKVQSEKRQYIASCIKNSLFCLSGNGKDLYITEGVADAISLHYATGKNVICPATTQFKKSDIEAILKVSKRYETTNIINDNEENRAGEKGAVETYFTLRKEGIDAFLVALPRQAGVDKVDVNDFLRERNHNGKELLELPRYKLYEYMARQLTPEQVERLEDTIEPIFKELLDEYGEGKGSIKAEKLLRDFFDIKAEDMGKYLDIYSRVSTSQQKGKSSKGAQKISHVSFATDDQGNIICPIIAKHFIQQSGLYPLTAADTIYIYQNGVYVPKQEILVSRIQEMLEDETTSHRIKEIVDFIRRNRVIEPDDMNPQAKIWINFENGMLNWVTGDFEEHSPEYLSTIRIPLIYNPDAKCPRIDAFLRSTLDEDMIPLIEEIFGIALIPDTRFEKHFILTGKGANGKSTLLKLLHRFIGSDNISNVPLQDMTGEDKFAVANIYGKLLNTFDDIPAKTIQETGILKALSSDIHITAQCKFKQPFEFVPFARLIFSCNELPRTTDKTYAFWRRWIIVPFERQFRHGDNAKENLIDEITTEEELSGFLNRALIALLRLNQNRKFSETPKMVQAMREYKLLADPVQAFVHERCVLGENCKVVKDSLFTEYTKYCETSKISSLGRNKFYEHIENTFSVKESTNINRIGKRRTFIGIGIKDEDLDEADDDDEG